MEYKLLNAFGLRNWWSFIREGLLEILKKSPENWIPEDIYSECINSRAFIYILLNKDKYCGFFVLQKIDRNIHIWVGYNTENNYEIVINAVKYIKELAKSSNCDNVTFSSNRLGWDKVAKKLNFKVRTWISEV